MSYSTHTKVKASSGTGLIKNFRSTKQFYNSIKNKLDNTPYNQSYFTLVPFFINPESLQTGTTAGTISHSTRELFSEQNLNRMQLFVQKIDLPSDIRYCGKYFRCEYACWKMVGIIEYRY